MSKRFEDMSIEELVAERDKWEKKIDEAPGWGAAVGAAYEFMQECERWIRRREAESDKREV